MHQLHGNGGTYGFPGISRVAEAAENAIDRKANFKSVSDNVTELIDLIRRVDGYSAADRAFSETVASTMAGEPFSKIKPDSQERKLRAA